MTFSTWKQKIISKRHTVSHTQVTHGMSFISSGTGIRTPTYRVRVCCATFTQYRYLFFVVGFAVFPALPSTVDIIPDSFSFVNSFFKKSCTFLLWGYAAVYLHRNRFPEHAANTRTGTVAAVGDRLDSGNGTNSRVYIVCSGGRIRYLRQILF